MKFNDVENIEADISKNEYVINDVKPKRSVQGLLNRIRGINLPDKRDLAIIPVVVLAAVSLGFLIAQIAEYASLSSITTILT